MSEEKRSEEIAAFEMLASQLACPSGQFGTALAVKMNESNEQITAFTISALAPQTGQKILEVGLGNGQLALPVIDKIGEKGVFLAVEKSRSMTKEANNLFGKKGLKNAYVKQGDFLESDIQEGIINGIYCVNVLYFIDDLSAFFKKVLSCLVSGGQMVMGVRSPKSLLAMPFTQYGFIVRETKEIEDVMKQAGFSNVKSQYHQEGEVELGGDVFSVDSIIITGNK